LDSDGTRIEDWGSQEGDRKNERGSRADVQPPTVDVMETRKQSSERGAGRELDNASAGKGRKGKPPLSYQEYQRLQLDRAQTRVANHSRMPGSDLSGIRQLGVGDFSLDSDKEEESSWESSGTKESKGTIQSKEGSDEGVPEGGTGLGTQEGSREDMTASRNKARQWHQGQDKPKAVRGPTPAEEMQRQRTTA
jgi:hypothetical protein